MGVVVSSRRNSRTMSSVRLTLPPWARARWPAAWIVLPSAIGSVKGMPSSMMSTPASGRPRMICSAVASSGSDAIM